MIRLASKKPTRGDLKSNAEDFWKCLVKADRISCYAYKAYFNVHYEHMCTQTSRKGAKKACKACENHREANAKSTFDQIDMANITMLVNATTPICSVNSEKKLSGVTLKMLKQRAFIHSFDTIGNDTYDASGHCEACTSTRRRRFCIVVWRLYFLLYSSPNYFSPISSIRIYPRKSNRMPHSYDDGGFLPGTENLNINNLQDLERAFDRNDEEGQQISTKLLTISAEIEALEEASARPDLAPPLRHISRVLRLRRQLLSDLDQLLDNWNVYMDLRDVEMHVEVFWGDMDVQDAADERYRHECHANRIRGLYVQAKRDWSEMLGGFVRMT
ncbi:hypothetical protein D6D01_05763 [Aureobasidium pullulans]|uniref:Uncharacterized protein n=1 Tax=Aureobasidium pullulans TaxID=5580 RepID=A0A4S9L4J3_AURPU|nr:hypothetical protein D6D01_05763 [Aureobasidium pullulans]